MSNNFKSGMLASVGTAYEAAYSTPATKKSILIELDIANRSNEAVVVNVGIGVGASTSPDFYIVKGAVVPTGDSLQVVAGQKIILDGTSATQKVFVNSSAASSVDVLASILEDVQ